MSPPTENPYLPHLPPKQSVKPRWLRDLGRFLPLKSQFVLSGNVLDLQAHEVAPGSISVVPLQAAVARELYSAGYEAVLSADSVRGTRLLSSLGMRQPASEILGRLGCDCEGADSPNLNQLGRLLERVVLGTGEPIGLILDFASRLIGRVDALSRDEQAFFTQALVYSNAVKPRPIGAEGKPYFNTVIWIVDKEGDLPDWLLLGNPKVRHIPIPKPDNLARRAVIPGLIRAFPGAATASEAERSEAESNFVDETEGLLLMDLQAITQLARGDNLRLSQITDAVRRYKVGVTDDPWLKIDRVKIRRAHDIITSRVKGQSHAVTHMLDIIKRSMTGMNASNRGGRPRGVAFLAGPTGVGKTELAKSITSLLLATNPRISGLICRSSPRNTRTSDSLGHLRVMSAMTSAENSRMRSEKNPLA